MSDSTVEVSFRADLSDLETGTAGAVALLGNAAQEMARSFEQLSLRQISAAERANNFELTMGEETLEQWKANARKEADAKLNAELAYLDRKLVADRGNAVAFQKDLDGIAAAYHEHADRLAAIDQQYAEKKHAQDQAAFQGKIQSDNAEYSQTVQKLDAELREHQISASQRRDAEIALAISVEQAELAMFDATHQGLVQGTAAWDQAMKQRQGIIDAFNKRVETANNQLTNEETQKWTQLSTSIRSSFNSAIDGMIFQGKSFEQGMLAIAEGVIKAFLEMGEKIAEDWIESQIEALFTTKVTQATAAEGQVVTEAGVAAATAYAQWAAFPPLAEAMAAEAFANTMAWGSAAGLAVGAWDIPEDMRAIIHKGEMVVPRNFASGLRANGGAFGSGDVNMHYAPTINAREPASLSQMLVTESSAMLSWLSRQFRNGALRA